MEAAMHRIILSTILFSLAFTQSLFAQDFNGTFASKNTDVVVILNLTQTRHNTVSGTMTFEGIEYSLNGKNQGDQVVGVLTGYGERIEFTANIAHADLILELNDAVETRDIHFTRLDADGGFEQRMTEAAPANGRVIINGNELSSAQVGELAAIYGFTPLPGEYWYDSKSGLYGVMGFAAYGFMFAGHDFGDLDPNASNGDSPIFVNGRRLSHMEWLSWSQLLGYMIQPGRYWLDADGNAGYEGNFMPMVNLYLAAQQNGSGQHNSSSNGNNGDNFWSSRFSAGNYDQGNQRGYVSVPGYGPVGYGF